MYEQPRQNADDDCSAGTSCRGKDGSRRLHVEMLLHTMKQLWRAEISVEQAAPQHSDHDAECTLH